MTKLRTILENIEYHWSQPHYNIFKSLYINFRCLPFNIARKLPIAIYGKCDFYQLKGKIRINGPIANDYHIRLGNNAQLNIGAYTFFGGNIRIISTTNIKIGDYSRIAYDSQLVDSNFHFVYNSIKHQTAPFYKEIIIGEYNWIGNKTSIIFSHKHEALLLDFFHKNPQAAYYEGIFDINSDKEISNEF